VQFVDRVISRVTGDVGLQHSNGVEKLWVYESIINICEILSGGSEGHRNAQFLGIIMLIYHV
jgi:hypothetical protein